jgi:hypothetical protein
MLSFSQILRCADIWMTGRTETPTNTPSESWTCFSSGFALKIRSVALAWSLLAAYLLAALLAGAVAVEAVGQAPVGAVSAKPGSLSGRLTDLRSTPLDGATVVLRNVSTGAEARTITQKNGNYRFTALPAGEYTILAESKILGQGSLDGIFVSSGSEARVQAAMEFAVIRPQPAEPDVKLAALTGSRKSIVPPVNSVIVEARFDVERQTDFAIPPRQSAGPGRVAPPMETAVILSALPTEGAQPFSLVARPAETPTAAGDESAEALSPVSLPAPVARTAAVVGRPQGEWALDVLKGIQLCNSAAQIAVSEARLRTLLGTRQHLDPMTPVVATTLTAEQIQALPVVGRNWQNFVLDTSSPSGQPSSSTSGSGITPQETTIDGVSTRLAFGPVSGSGRNSTASGSTASGSPDGSPSQGMAQPWASGRGFQVAEAAVRAVESAAGSVEAEASRAAGGHMNVTTQQGGQGLHGQGFLFDRQNSWGARNPFTTWVQQTTPATAETVPGYTAEPYTPPDHEIVWGAGAGSEWKRRKLFWFGAIDRYQRNDPAVSTVKHPYLVDTVSGCTIGPCTELTGFFAQPSNDQMQVLAARLGLSAVNPVTEGLAAYSNLLQTLAGLLGPAPRTASQWVEFARLDWQAAEHHRFTLEAIGGRWDSPGGGLTRVSETYGSHSLGNGVASEELLMARWEAFLTSNFLAVTQASAGRNILATHAETPSTFEQSLLGPSIWGQLPQMVVDSRYGFTIGNPARFGRGSYPDERVENVKQGFDWVRGSLLMKAGFELAHNADATSLLRNQTGTYHYSTVENFASDALAFQKFGVAGELNPYDQHNCDQTGHVWTDSGGNIRGLGYLPCYSYYSQMIGPSDTQVSTNDWAGFATAQWQPAKRMVLSAGLRWEREQLPTPIADLNNPELPLTQKSPSLGNNWGPRVSMALGSGESHWPVLRLGYGMYFSATPNQVIETALSQTGSFNGDLSFFMRPTDNLNQGGAPPFPYVLAGAPGSLVKPGAVEFAPQFHNPEVNQAVAELEEELPGRIQVTASALLSLGRRLPVPIDTNLYDPAVNPAVKPGTITYAVEDASGSGPIKAQRITAPFYASWPTSSGSVGWLNPDYQEIDQIMSIANSTYEAAILKVTRYGRRGLSLHAHYTYSHAMDWNPNESPLDPEDFRQEYGTSNLDIRHSAAVMAIYEAPWKLRGIAGKFGNGWIVSGIGQFHSGLPYTMRISGSLPECLVSAGVTPCNLPDLDTGLNAKVPLGTPIMGLRPGMLGSGGDNRVYGLGNDGHTYNIGRNTFRYPATWKADLRLAKRIDFGHLRQLEVMAETFNLFNHQNVTELETTGYFIEPGDLSGGLPTLNFLNGLKANTTAFGQPLNINATNFYRERQIQVGMRMRF